MTADVKHRRPVVSTDKIKTSLAVGSPDWLAMCDAVNWVNGHGVQLVPFCAVTTELTSGNFTVEAVVSYKDSSVGIVVFVTAFAPDDAQFSVEVSGTGLTTTTRTVAIYGGTNGANAYASIPVAISTKQSPGTQRVVAVKFTHSSGTVQVMGFGIYAQTRAVLDQDATDYGVERTSALARRPIADFDQRSAGGLIEAYKNMDARRAGYLNAGMESGTGLVLTATTQTDILPVHVPMLAPIDGVGDTQLALDVVFEASVDTGSATVFADSDQAGGSASTAVATATPTSFTVSINVDAEDFSVVDGRRGSAWEALQLSYACDTGTTLTIHHLSVLRKFTPI